MSGADIVRKVDDGCDTEAGPAIVSTAELNSLVTSTPDESESSTLSSLQPSAQEPAEHLQPLSKNAQKKAARAVRFAEKKLERRAREKAAKKAKKCERREQDAEGVHAGDADRGDREPLRKRARKDASAKPFDAQIVVDLGFDGLMTDKEIASLCSQLAYTYSANRKARCPFRKILFTSLNGRTRERLDSQSDAGYRRWAGTEWWEEEYDQLWTGNTTDEINRGEDAANDKESENKRSRSEKDKVVYLTADADNELEELKESESYIIGGICDHNRHKNLCQRKAVDGGIRSARLPIGKYLAEMTTRKVLTVNQVFEILVHWTESRNWEEALYSVVPKRKFQTPSGKADTLTIKESEIIIKDEKMLSEEVGLHMDSEGKIAVN